MKKKMALSGSEEKTPTVSPDQGATGETVSSSKTMEAGTQTGLSEEEEEAHYKKANDDAITKLWENIYLPDQEVDWEVLIGKLLVHFARENRSKRPEKPDFLNLNKLEALRTEHLKASGHEPWGLVRRIE